MTKLAQFSVTMDGRIRISLHGYTSLTIILNNWKDALKYVSDFGDKWNIKTRLI